MYNWREYVREHLPRMAVSPERENEIVAELALQMEQAYQDAIAAGLPASDAADSARAQFSDWRALGREIESEQAPRARWWTGGGRDLRFAARYFRRNPLFAAIPILTLAFAIGGNTAVFTIVDTLLLRGLPYRQPDRLMAIETRSAKQPEIEPFTSPSAFYDLRERTRAFESMMAVDPVWNLVLTGRGEAEQLKALYVSASFFPMLGVQPLLGRGFTPEEDNPQHPRDVAVVSYGFWQRRLGGARDAVGQKLAMSGAVYEIVGVMPRGFRYEGEPIAGSATDIDIYAPLAANPLTSSARPRTFRCLKVIGRLKQGVTPERGRDEIRQLASAFADEHPEAERGFRYDAQPLGAQVSARLRGSMMLLLVTVGFVLLMACANVANLLLARSAERQPEISVRLAIGAPRWRLVRQLTIEGLVLAIAGGVAGLALAAVALRLLIAVGPESLMRAREIAIDGRGLAATVGAVVFCTLVAALPPAWRMARAELGVALRETSRAVARGRHRLRSGLVVLQVTVAFMLLVGAGLLVRSFAQLLDVSPGFDTRNLLTISTQMPASGPGPARQNANYLLMSERLLSVPGVRSVAAVSRVPMMGMNLTSYLTIEGKPAQGAQLPEVEYRVATSDYFATMGIPLRDGRIFDEHDDANAKTVVVINHAMARMYWPGESAVGKRIKFGDNPGQQEWIAIIGVVGDVRHFGLDVDARPEIYRPYAVNPLSAPVLLIRTNTDAAALVQTLAAKVRSIGPDVPAYNSFLMQELVDRSTAQRRFIMLLLAGFAVCALLLAAVGVYGTVSQAVAQRTREIGVRMALGASPASALALMFREGAVLAGIGIAVGAIAAAGLTRLLTRLLFGVRPLDPLSFVAAAGSLAIFAAVACYLPARRATRVDPLTALRME
jgi:macrolide transport system ATP-binding/permease protein